MTPKFCKQYAQVGNVITEALLAYRDDVTSGGFPGTQYSPYHMKAVEVDAFANALSAAGLTDAAEAAANTFQAPPPVGKPA